MQNKNEETIKSFLDKLDYSIKSNEERINLVTRLLEKPNYFDSLNGNINKYASHALEIISDYMMAGVDGYPSVAKMEKPNKYDVSLDSVQEVDNEMFRGNHYINAVQKITSRDFKDPELAPYLNDYQRYKERLQKIRDKAKFDKNGKLKYRCDKIIGDINQSMIEVKNAIKKPIRFKNVKPVKDFVNWLECDYTNIDHVRALLIINPKKLINDMGILTYDIFLMLKKIKLSKSERKIINFIRHNDNMTQAEIGSALECTQSYINSVIKNIAKKIVEYNIKLESNKKNM